MRIGSNISDENLTVISPLRIWHCSSVLVYSIGLTWTYSRGHSVSVNVYIYFWFVAFRSFPCSTVLAIIPNHLYILRAVPSLNWRNTFQQNFQFAQNVKHHKTYRYRLRVSMHSYRLRVSMHQRWKGIMPYQRVRTWLTMHKGINHFGQILYD
jgi:hypothetical protein